MPFRSALRAVLLALVLPAAARAQELSLMGGKAEYDLSGVHTDNVWAVRAAAPAVSFLLVEGSVSHIHTRQQFGRSRLWIPEAQLQAQATLGALAPYLGVGVGAAIDDPEDDALDPGVDLATSVAAGVRVQLTDRVGVRLDGRLHGIEIDYTGTVTGLTAGLTIGL